MRLSVTRANSTDPPLIFPDKFPDLFASASVPVMPYTSATGSSGVAHQACQFGLPIACADLPEFREMAQGEGLALKFFRVGDQQSLTDALVCLLNDLELQRSMAEQNYSASVRLTMPEIVRQYLRSFDWLRHRVQPPPWKLRRSGVFAPVVSWKTLASRPETRLSLDGAPRPESA